MEKPFKDRKGLVVRYRNNQIRGDVIGVNVDHQIREYPEIKRLLQTGSWHIKPLSVAALHRPDWRKLLRIVTKRVRAVLCVINLAHQAGMRDRNVVALQVIIDVNLPIAVDHIISALLRLQSIELKSPRLP